MQAYEFNATIQDGIIHIPEQLADENLSWVKVILLADSVKRTADSRKGKFTAMQLKTKGFKFNREEAHER